MIPSLPAAPGALAGLRVLDLTRVLAGPYCTMILGDFGAEIIKVEQPGRGDETRQWGPPFNAAGESAYYLAVNRNKRSLALDLKNPRGLEAFRRLAASADVLVESYRPGTAARLGIDYESLHPVNPRLVYASISGFGATGPYADRGGYDIITQGASGIMSVTGQTDGPPLKAGVPVTDIGAGMLCAFGILAALAGAFAHDVEEDEPPLVEREDGSWLVSGAASADLLADRLGVNLPHDRDYSTVAGFALSVLKHLPQTGETFSHDGWKFEVVDMDGRKIDKLLASRPKRRSREQEPATVEQD